MKKILLGAMALLSLNGFAQNVNIPDANFKAALVGNSSINTNGDSEIQVTEAQTYSGGINVSNQNISDLTGIEAFTNIVSLSCSQNNLTSVDLTSNSALQYVTCFSSSITDLNLSNLASLVSVNCNVNSITNLTLTNCSALEVLLCQFNNITSIDVSTNTALQRILISNNQLASLDVSNNLNLEELECINNQLTTIDFSNNTNLFNLRCQNNQLGSLDLSNTDSMVYVFCDNNNLSSLNLANGNNGEIVNMVATSNPNLSCIQIDAGFTPSGWWSKDATASYSDNCGGSSCSNFVNIPDANFKAYLVGNSSINTDGDGEICQTEAQAFTGAIYAGNQNISDLTGIEAFTSLTSLYCYGNSLTSLDVSQNTALENLDCYNNSLSSLDVSQNTALTLMYCSNNNLTSLNVANGNNGTSSPSLYDVDATFNPNLTCIQHDTGFDPTTSSWQKDATASWSDNCGLILVSSISVQGQGGGTSITTAGGTLQMEATILPSDADDMTYTWSVTNGTGSATIDANGLLTAVADGTVDVIATANDGSGVTGSATITISNQTASINENSIAFSIVPNPTSGMVKIDSDIAIKSVEIYATSGQKVASFDSKEFDLSELENGVYFLTVFSSRGMATKRIIKQ